MKKQEIFDFKFNNENNHLNFYVNTTNAQAYHGALQENNRNIFIIGPSKSGKTFLANLWLNKFSGIKYYNNFHFLIEKKSNIIIDDIHLKSDNQENIFHLINHCKNFNLKILITSNLNIDEIEFSLYDLISRLKTFNQFKINQPDDDMLLNILTKLFIDKQFVINSAEIFNYILHRSNRSYEDMFNIVKKLDKLSLEKKRQLTIPLIKEIL